MATLQDRQQIQVRPAVASSTSNTILLVIAAAIILLHLFTNSRYGFHRDELQFLADAQHLDWGFVVYPPVTPLLGRIGLSLFGLSLVGLRLMPVLAQAIAIVVTGLMARELGGKQLAQITAALSVALTPVSLHYGTEFIYSSFDYLWWILTAYFVIRLLKSENPRWWPAIGATLGVGIMTKYTILGFAAGILCGFFFTPARRYLLSGWFSLGAAIALLIVFPNLLWQVKHQFITAHSLHAIHLRDISIGRANGFIPEQFFDCVCLISTPVWIAGLAACLFSFRLRRYRPLAWMYLVPLVLLMLARARSYYVAPAYPMLLAIGAIIGERWLAAMTHSRQSVIKSIYFTCLIAYGLICCTVILPIASSGPLRDFALSHNPDLRDETGWDEMVKTVATIRNSLPPAPTQSSSGDWQTSVGILAGNYGNRDAIAILGPAYGLPAPIGGMNSGWLRGYPQPAPTILIVVGFSSDEANSLLTSCRFGGVLPVLSDVRNDEFLLRRSIYICGPPRDPWPIFWKQMRSFG